MWYCYLILSQDNITYIGITNNLERRLKQHNREISGGAKCTRKSSGWHYIKTCQFNNKIDASKFEWNWKHIRSKSGKWRKTSGLNERLARFDQLVLQSVYTASNG